MRAGAEEGVAHAASHQNEGPTQEYGASSSITVEVACLHEIGSS
jgi:hypothetical protein